MMTLRAVFAVVALAVPAVVAAQDLPQLPPGMTPEQAQRMLEQRPELGRLLRERLLQSGLTAAEIRTRLRAAGYPASMLDAYLTGDTLGVPDPSAELVNVISRLGLARFSRRDSLTLTGDTTALRMMRDSLRSDSLARADSLDALRRGLRLFGLDVFREATTRFQPLVTGPVSDTYVLGPGDELVLVLTGAVEVARQLPVTNTGFVVIPDVGQIYVNGLTLGQLKEVLYDRLARVYSGVTRGPNPRTKFDVVVANVRVQTIRVAGEVAVPGSYELAATGTVLSALYEAGGLTERAGFRKVHVLRGRDTIATVDLYDYLVHGVTPRDVALGPGDVVFVPVRGARVKIGGAVVRPAEYEAKEGETLRDMIRIAGGLLPTAATHALTISRVLPPSERLEPGRSHTTVTVDLQAVINGSAQPVPIVAGDSITVFSVSGGKRNAVTVAGGVWQPGTYALEPGMRLADLLAMAGGLRPEAYTGRGQVLRTLPDSTRRLIGVALPTADDPTAGDNPALQELDSVTVFVRTDFRAERHIGVYGAVQKPGQVVFADSITIKDAILLAGGLREDASLLEAEVSRFVSGGSGDSLAVVFRTPLDSSFILDDDGYLTRPVGAGNAPVVTLQPYDNVMVRPMPGWTEPRTVTITGEVQYPGTYTLARQDERLASVLQRTGGLTTRGYANGIRFFRLGQRPERDSTRPRDLRRSAAYPMPFADTSRLLQPAAQTPMSVPPSQLAEAALSVGRIGVDLPEVLRNANHPHNLILEAGDSIHIPRFVAHVRVEGAVNAPGAAVPHRPGAGIGYYVDGAGGYAAQADKGKKFVQQPNGLMERGSNPEPGAVVVVPFRDPSRRGTSLLDIFGALGPLLSAVTTIVVILATR